SAGLEGLFGDLQASAAGRALREDGHAAASPRVEHPFPNCEAIRARSGHLNLSRIATQIAEVNFCNNQFLQTHPSGELGWGASCRAADPRNALRYSNSSPKG